MKRMAFVGFVVAVAAALGVLLTGAGSSGATPNRTGSVQQLAESICDGC